MKETWDEQRAKRKEILLRIIYRRVIAQAGRRPGNVTKRILPVHNPFKDSLSDLSDDEQLVRPTSPNAKQGAGGGQSDYGYSSGLQDGFSSSPIITASTKIAHRSIWGNVSSRLYIDRIMQDANHRTAKEQRARGGERRKSKSSNLLWF